MKVLLHTCCAPCLLIPLQFFIQKDYDVTVYFYNPNIHPFKEFKKRVDCLNEFTNRKGISLVLHKDYGLVAFMRKVVFNEHNRCSICYDLRLKNTALYAKENGYDYFSSTLLYSKYQNHTLIQKKCLQLSVQNNVGFFYHDFREGWQNGIDNSITENLYRQPYCGCIFSEQERYDNRLKKQLRKKRKNLK